MTGDHAVTVAVIADQLHIIAARMPPPGRAHRLPLELYGRLRALTADAALVLAHYQHHEPLPTERVASMLTRLFLAGEELLDYGEEPE